MAYDDEDEEDYLFENDYGLEDRTSQIAAEDEEEPAAEDDYEEDEDSQGEDNEDQDDDEDEDDDDDDDDEEDEEGDEEEEEGDSGDIDMRNEDEGSPTSTIKALSPSSRALPPHLIRRGLFTPDFAFHDPPSSLSIEAIVGIPLPVPVHCLAATACSSYLLTGGGDGYVRAYDFWSSVNGGQSMTAQQKGVVGLGDGVGKAGVARGWWGNEVDETVPGQENGVNGSSVREDGRGKKLEPVYSMTTEGDGLWALTGTRSGPINLYSLRHAPGHLIHTLHGHSNVVSCMSLLPGEKSFLSGSWDGTLKEWDLNTGQVVRTYPTHGAQISSMGLRPILPPSPPVTPRQVAQDEDEGDDEDVAMDGERVTNGHGLDISVNLRVDSKPQEQGEAETSNGTTHGLDEKPRPDTTGDASQDSEAPMNTESSPYDPLFDDDAEGEEVPPSDPPDVEGILDIDSSTIPDLPTSSPLVPTRPTLSLPGMIKPTLSSSNSRDIPPPSATSSGTPLFAPSSAGPSRPKDRATQAHGIPLLSPTEYSGFSDDVLMYSSMDGQVTLVDRRVGGGKEEGGRVGRLMGGDKAPPWCMSACWSSNGTQILAGRRNGTVDIWDVRRPSSTSSSSSSSLHTPNLLHTLRTPTESGPVSCLVALPDGRHVATASQDNIRLWNTYEYFDDPSISVTSAGQGIAGRSKGRSGRPPFKIIAGHHGGTISSMLVDPTCRFLVTASGDRGWQGESTKVVLIHEIKW